MDTYHIDMRSYRNVGWVWFAVCLAIMVAALLSGLYLPAAGIGFSSLFGGYMALGAGSFDIDSTGLTHTSSFGAWQIRWDEITRVEIAEVEGTLVLHGPDKRFVLSSPSWWPDSVKQEAFAFVIGQLETRNIPPIPSRTAGYKFMKNTRVAG